MKEEQIYQKALEVIPPNLSEIDGYDWNEDERNGYIKALKEIEELPKIRGWVARDLQGLQFSTQKPVPDKDDEDEWFDFGSSDIIVLPESFSKYFKLKEMDEPIKVELLIKKI